MSVGAQDKRGSVIERIGTYRDQPALSGSTFTPGNFGYDWDLNTDDVKLIDNFGLNPTKWCRLLNQGRLELARNRCGALVEGLRIEGSADTNEGSFRVWPHASLDPRYAAWTLANLYVLVSGRNDNAAFGPVFGIYARALLRIIRSDTTVVTGTTNKMTIQRLEADLSASAIAIDANVSGATVNVDNLFAQGPGGTAPSIPLIDVPGSNCRITIGAARFTDSRGYSASLSGANNSLIMGATVAETFAQDNVTTSAFFAAASNYIEVATAPAIGAAGSAVTGVFSGAGTYRTGAGIDPIGRVVAQGMNSAPPPTRLVAQGGTDGLPAGSGVYTLIDVDTGNVAVAYVANGATFVENKLGTQFVALNPGDTSANAVTRTSSSKVGVYYDTTRGSYALANNKGSTLSYGYGQTAVRSTS